jgi:hypothetical protein
MKTRILLITLLSLITAAIPGVMTATAQENVPRVSTPQVQRLLTRIETKIEVLKEEADRAATRTGRQNQDATDVSDLGRYLTDLNTSISRLDNTYDAHQPVDNDLREAMTDATVVDQFMTRNRVSVSAQAQWRSLKRDLNTLASYNRLSWNWNQTIPDRTTTGGYPGSGYPGGVNTGNRPYAVPDSEIQALISRIQNNTELFERQVTTALNNNRTGNAADAQTMSDYILGLEASTLRLKQHFDARQSTDSDVSDVLTSATYIDQFMSRNRLPFEAESQWRNLRTDLTNLAAGYRVSWNWNQTLPSNPGQNSGPGGGRRLDVALSGTYRLNTRLSENVSAAVDRALGTASQTQNQGLQRRLTPPEMIAIEKNNATVSMASSNRPRVTFQADGVARTETTQNGRTFTTTATADADSLIINYQGERANDFYVTFAPSTNGQLRVTRRVYIEETNQPVSVTSVYDKIDPVARWNMVTTGGDNTATGIVNNTFVVPSGTRLTAVLTTPITAETARPNDRITLDVTAPTQYRGARISGHLITEDASNRVSGRSRVMVSFDSITLRNGQSYRFDGLVNAVIAADGSNIAVAQQTPARQTTGVGGILGALIGAISGQPIDQTVAPGVSGSILTQASDVFSLGQSSQFVITASSGTNVSQFR